MDTGILTKHTDNSYHRYASAPYPYPTRGGFRPPHRGGRPHQHRTLHFNNGTPTTAAPSHEAGAQSSTAPAAAGPSGWVTKNDRHRQLINANIFEKESQNRAKAIQETWNKKQQARRQREKARLGEYLRRQQAIAGVPSLPSANPSSVGAATSNNEIMVGDIRFRVLDGGKKLARVAGDIDGASSSPTPKSTVIAGVKFHRTKTGNLVVNRVVKDQRYVSLSGETCMLTGCRRSGTVKKIDELCKMFTSSGRSQFSHATLIILPANIVLGSCPKGPMCRYTHDPNKVALCKEYLKEGKCALGQSCDLSHDMSPERVPNCLHFAKGHCAKAESECPYTHSKASPASPVCRSFGRLGYCARGADCVERHVFECPDFSNTGRCNTRGCKLLHRERASMLRGQQAHGDDEPMDDVSSDDEPTGDSDDVDSDEVAEFIDADSDASDVEDHQDFIAV